LPLKCHCYDVTLKCIRQSYLCCLHQVGHLLRSMMCMIQFRSSSFTFNVTRTQSVKDHTRFTILMQCWTVPRCQTTSVIWQLCLFSFSFIFIFLSPTFGHCNRLFAVVITLGFHLHHVEVVPSWWDKRCNLYLLCRLMIIELILHG